MPGRASRPPLGLAMLLAALVACGGQGSDVRCTALTALRDALGALDLAEAAERSRDPEAVRGRIDDVARLVGRARTSLGSGTDGHTRRLLEAANYLEFIVQDYATTGRVDATTAQFASRELNRAVPGEPSLAC